MIAVQNDKMIIPFLTGEWDGKDIYMNTLSQLKQDYNEVVEIMSNYTFSLESIKELNDHLHRTGHDTLIEINGEPIDEIETIKESEIKWIRLDDYNNLNCIYFNKDWQTNEAEKVMFDAYTGVDDIFMEDLHINHLDNKYVEYMEYFSQSTPDIITSEIMSDLAESENWKCRREAAWSEKSPADVLKELANDPDDSVRQAVAVNRNTPLDALKQLCEDKDIDVRNYAKETVNDVFLKDPTTEDYEDFLYSRKKAEFEKAKNYIADYLQTEYSSEADFSNLFHIGIGYTEIGSVEQGDFLFQVEANLVDCEINYYIDGETVKTEKYDSLAQMNECRLSCLDFDDFLHVGTTELDRIFEEKSAVTTVLAVSQCDTNRYYIANNVTENEVRKAISNSDKLFMDLCALGNKQIDEAAFAEYSQTEGVTAIGVNIDEKAMHIYDAEKPIVSFNEIRNDQYIKQLDDVISTCLKIKEAIINGELDMNRNAPKITFER